MTGTRMLTSCSGLVGALLASFVIAGCMGEGQFENEAGAGDWIVDPALDPETTNDQALESLPVDPSVAPDEVVGDEGLAADDDLGVASDHCARVQWCNESGPVGSVCIWTGCTLAAALNDCVEDTWFLCGTPSCPWEFRDRNGNVVARRSPCPGPRP